jgi:cytochrome c1
MPVGVRRGVGLAFFVAVVAGSGCTAAAAPGSAPGAAALPATPRTPLTPAPDVPGSAENGRTLFLSAGCGGCHTLGGLVGATGVAGPNLTNVVLRPTLAGETIPMSTETMTRWLRNPAAVKPGATMPSVGLTEPEARDLTAFLYSQPYNSSLR